VGLRPTTVVRLERALAHEVLPLHDIGGAHPPVGGCARGGRGWTASCRPPGDPGSWSLRTERTATSPGRSSQDSSSDTGHDGRTRPQTSTSITEETLRPATGRIPTAHGPPARCPRKDGTPEPTRPGDLPDRCRAVDRAVSVAVAPRRTSGSRRVGRPPRSTDRRIARSSAPTAH
jgi:hypothetical protein